MTAARWSTVVYVACIGAALATVAFCLLSWIGPTRLVDAPPVPTTAPVVLIPPVSVTRGGGS